MPLEPEREDFKPSEPYTQCLRRILEDYLDGSQVLREILQNSDDAQGKKNNKIKNNFLIFATKSFF
jgi:hypothetical protein